MWCSGMGRKNAFKYFGRVEWMKSEEFKKKVYVSETEDLSRRRPLVR